MNGSRARLNALHSVQRYMTTHSNTWKRSSMKRRDGKNESGVFELRRVNVQRRTRWTIKQWRNWYTTARGFSRLWYYSDWSKTSHVDAKTWQGYITRHSIGTPVSIGQYLLRQLNHVAVPVFSVNRKTYENWKVVFKASIGVAPLTADYKLLQLRKYLSGEALKSIEGLGFASEGETWS